MSSSDLIHIVCQQCGKQEVCPDTLNEHFPETDDSPSTLPIRGDKRG